MNQKLIRKIVVYVISILIVCGVVGGGIYAKNKIEQAKEEAQYEPPKAVMSQEEIEALYDEHKTDDLENDSADNEGVQGDLGTEVIETSVQSDILSSKESQTADGIKEIDSNTVTVYNGCPVDFAGMWEVNEDVYAWITVPGTVIDYPILQHATDNTYYLNYNIDGSYGYPGCIYTENMNSKDFTDNNTVIYGHNMKNGTMFAGLHKFEDASFFEKNNTILIYTPEKQLTYTIFAAYVYDDRHLLYSFNFADEAVYANYLNEILNMRSMNANIRGDVGVTAEDKIITLVTCMGNQPDKRLLVQAVLQNSGE